MAGLEKCIFIIQTAHAVPLFSEGQITKYPYFEFLSNSYLNNLKKTATANPINHQPNKPKTEQIV